MKKLIILLSLIIGSINGYGQPLVYFNFVTHNEETSQWNNVNYYSINREKLISLANYFQSNGISWNMQSDWVYLTNVLNEDSSLMASTNNKNILRWMFEDKGVEMDPHGHESQYIYPDLVKLMDSIGLPESKLMGGTLYNKMNGINIWTNLINGQYGVVFPNYFWQPDYMMGGGTPGHVNDIKYYGFWNPKDTANYLTHDSTSHLRHIGVGCEIKIKETTSVAEIVDALKDVVQKVQSGQYPSNGFYLQSIFFEQGDLNNALFYNKVIEVADSVNAIAVSGYAQWKTLKQAYYLWETVNNAQMFQQECEEFITDIPILNEENTFILYPNPFSNSTTLQITNKVLTNVNLKIYDLFGREVFNKEIKNQKIEILREGLAKGIYFYLVKDDQKILSKGELIIN